MELCYPKDILYKNRCDRIEYFVIIKQSLKGFYEMLWKSFKNITFFCVDKDVVGSDWLCIHYLEVIVTFAV